MSNAININCDFPIINVFVVGFHHKKGCVVEYSYPPLFDEENVKGSDLPEPWKHLPTLALPDGAHNYEKDTIYFHLPSLENPQQTVFGISCYRQMNAEKLLRRSSDITRETVQKSVCVLSKVPLYGLIQAKLELITHAYFDERDFSKVSLLEETFKNLNSSLPKDLSDGHQTFLGLSVRDFVLRFKHKALLLFKLLLLEKKVLFYKAPVKDLCSALLTLCSLIPGMIEKGLTESATSSKSSPLITMTDKEDFLEISFKDNNNKLCHNSVEGNHCSTNPCLKGESEESAFKNTYNMANFDDIKSTSCATLSNIQDHTKAEVSSELNSDTLKPKTQSTKKLGFVESEISSKGSSQNSSDTELDSWVKVNNLTSDIGSSTTSNVSSTDTEVKLNEEGKPFFPTNELHDSDNKSSLNHSSSKIQDGKNDTHKEAQISQNAISTVVDGISNIASSLRGSQSVVLPSSTTVPLAENETRRWSASHSQNQRQDSTDSMKNNVNVIDLELDECGLPLSIFTKGMLCHPYLSLPFLDLLNDLNVRGCLVGATNILFKQKKQLFDVIVEVDDGKIDIVDPELKKQLYLTTEDLRFADHLVRHVMEDKHDVFLDGTGWEGGDEWLRSQFKLYLLSLMRTSEIETTGKEGESFNLSFMNAWKTTHNYKIWSCSNHLGVLELNPGHPFQGQLSVADMKLKFSHTMQSSERGRRLNTAVLNTGKAVVQTGKAVGGALTSAKSVVSSWWSGFNIPIQQEKRGEEEIEQINPAQEDETQQPKLEEIVNN